MKLIVCNCNAYGNIDYGHPVLYTQTDYRTATTFGHRYIPPVAQTFYRIKPHNPGKNIEHLLEPKQQTFKSETTTSYNLKSQNWNPNSKARLSSHGSKVHYIQNVKEKVFQNPPRPRPFPLTESSEEYQIKSIKEPVEAFKNVDFNRINPISSQESDVERIKIEDGGFIKLLDPYATTNNLDYITYTNNQKAISRKHVATYYETNNNPEIKKSTVKEPMYDTQVFKSKATNRIVAQLVFRVPHTGKTSEYQHHFKLPTKPSFAARIFYNGVEYPESLPKPSVRQALAAPNMYCTDYCHIGTGWPVQASVNPKIHKKHEIKHIPCVH